MQSSYRNTSKYNQEHKLVYEMFSEEGVQRLLKEGRDVQIEQSQVAPPGGKPPTQDVGGCVDPQSGSLRRRCLSGPQGRDGEVM